MITMITRSLYGLEFRSSMSVPFVLPSSAIIELLKPE